MTPALICPVCKEPLSRGGQALVCENRHSYDIAAAGYCNLLRPGKLRNRASGDDREMVAARGKFLAAEYYRPVLDYIIKTVTGVGAGSLIDAGCGEGYYTNGTALAVPELGVLGFDASKHAVAAAARGAKRSGAADRVHYITASSADIPVADDAADLVLSLFSPCQYGEFARITKRGGHLLVGSAGVSHLSELKAVLYGADNVRPNAPIDHPAMAGEFGYIPVSRENVTFTATIDGHDDIDALFSMTPYRWRTPKAGAEALLRLDAITVTVDVDFTLLKLR